MFEDEFEDEVDLDEKEAWVYDFFCGCLLFFLKYLEISIISLDNFAGIGEGRDNTNVGFTVFLSLLFDWGRIICGLNFNFTLFLKVVLNLSTNKLSHQYL